ncbi:hypothetical protein [Natribacillus halophilus]|uniref:Uncharacterized protein n=1 Tax=Natribacillus halophilus TaxID=549003 RepID=A0A1G8LBB0_9BACI|nr:hypothetical protein [Natribacillus halophilus]SDI52903.1 hypothetical protein SAMN04488123_1035 [Natribacillus halophilus]
MKVINIKDLRMKNSSIEKENKLWEFDDYFEYCLIDDYESIFDKFKVESIKIDDYFVSILESGKNYLMIALLFPKTYNVHEIVDFLDNHSFGFNEKDENGYFIDNAASIETTLLFKGMPIVVSTIGNDKIYFSIDGLTEITDSYQHYHSIVNTADASKVDVQKEMEKNQSYEPFADWDDSITLGKQTTYLDDGRYIRADVWAEDGYTFITYSFSAKGIENYSGEQLTKYLKQNGMSQKLDKDNYDFFRFTDQDSNDRLSVTIVVGEADDW